MCADGGITCPGDAAKAFGGGADFIMMGGIFAGTEEAAGSTIHVSKSPSAAAKQPPSKGKAKAAAAAAAAGGRRRRSS